VELEFSVQGHPTTDTLEEYSFNRLSEIDAMVIDDHLLVCSECQISLADVENCIRLMKQMFRDERLHHTPGNRPRRSCSRRRARTGE
jgi:hypothetical protein